MMDNPLLREIHDAGQLFHRTDDEVRRDPPSD